MNLTHLALALAVIALLLVVAHIITPAPPAHTYNPLGIGTRGDGATT